MAIFRYQPVVKMKQIKEYAFGKNLLKHILFQVGIEVT